MSSTSRNWASKVNGGSSVGKLDKLRIFRDDYPTREHTGVGDYLHVTDLAIGHPAALEKLESNPGLLIHNLGIGQGYSVLEVVDAFREASGRDIPLEIMDRRPRGIAETLRTPS